MATSQNGWPASPTRSDIGVTSFVVAGVSFPGGVRGGDVATVLGYVVEQIHRRVEPLHGGWCWGYNYREVRASVGLSNHASGTAVDINAPNHPLGVRGTFSQQQVGEIHRILAEVGVVRWGGDYSGRVDEMHFEINASASAVASAAVRLRARTVTPEEDEDMGERSMTIDPPVRPGEAHWATMGVPPVGGSRPIPKGGAVQAWLQLSTVVEDATIHELLFMDGKRNYLFRKSDFFLPWDTYAVGLTAFQLPEGCSQIAIRCSHNLPIDFFVYWK